MNRDDVKAMLDAYGQHVNSSLNPYPPQSSIAFASHIGSKTAFGSKLPRFKNTPPDIARLQIVINKLLLLSYVHRHAMQSVLLRHVHALKPSDVAKIIKKSIGDERRQYIMGLDFIITAYAFLEDNFPT